MRDSWEQVNAGTVRHAAPGASFLPDRLEIAAGADQPPRAPRLDRLEQGAGGVADLLLDGLVFVERLVAGRIGLEIADIAVELRRHAGRGQAHEAQPVAERAADILRALHVAMDDDREEPPLEMARIGPAGELQL